MSFRLKFCTRDAARKACRRWHYSKTMPTGKGIFIGVWEMEVFIGAVVFSRGANRNIAEPYGLTQQEVCELTRVALTRHQAPVSQILAVALGILRKKCPGIQVVVSYADSEQGHLGKIYQAGNWIHDGSAQGSVMVIHGERVHKRTVTSRYGQETLAFIKKTVDPEAHWDPSMAKFRYVFPMTKRLRRQLQGRALTYPNAGASSEEPSFQEGQGGSIPTLPLQTVTAGPSRA